MVDIKSWVLEFTNKVEQIFSDRVWFIGLQGSYGRGEATETSDIDVVVILDELRINDLKVYRDMLDTLSNRELVCGFISGKGELLNWEASDLFQFYYDTTPIKGTLDCLLFVLQAIWFYETDKYIKSKAELHNAIDPPSAVLTTALNLKNGADVKFEDMSVLLINWAKACIGGYGE